MEYEDPIFKLLYGDHSIPEKSSFKKSVRVPAHGEPRKTKKTQTIDVTSKLIGHIGRWQVRISILMAITRLPLAWYQLNIMFMAPPQEFWCKKPEKLTKYTEEEWRKICSPHVEEHPCLVYDPDYLLITPHLDKTLVPLVPCEKFVYDTKTFSRTILSDWDLVCSYHYLAHICQCVMMFGILIGSMVFGIYADRHGRKSPLMISIVIQTITGIISSFVPWYSLFLVNWFILAMATGGLGITSFVMCMEVVSGQWRTIIPVLCQIPFGFGTAIMAGLAYWLRDWRKLEFALAVLSSTFLFYWFCIPESPRWLIATGQTDKALRILIAAANENRRKIEPMYIKELRRLPKQVKIPSVGFMRLLRSKNMRTKTILLSLNWFCAGLSFYTFSQYLGTIGNNIFMTVGVTGLLSTLGGLSCIYFIIKLGRKATITTYQILTTICLLSLYFMPRNMSTNDWLRMLFGGIGFAGMSGTVPALYLYSGELFPTLVRNVGVSGVTTFARLASLVAPAMAWVEALSHDLPLMILIVISFLQIIMLLPLPETKDVPLPESLEEAEKI